MLIYNDLYDLFRKEKYSENLMQLDKNFISEFSEYLRDLRNQGSSDSDFFSDNVGKSKKQLENSIAIFKGLILRRKKKLLNLVFVAAETGILKRDYENMLDFEKKIFDKLVKAFDEGDKELARALNGRKEGEEEKSKMVIFEEGVEQFVDMTGNLIGPFAKGELANLDSAVCEVLVSGKKAKFVDD